MGTSGSFGGSGGKDAADLRGAIADWLDDQGAPDGDAADPADAHQGGDTTPSTSGQDGPTQPTPFDLAPALRVMLRSRGGGGGAAGGGAGGGGQAGGGRRGSGGATRSVGRVSRATGRAGHLALAYTTGDSATLAQAGLNYGELRGLGDPIAVGLAIVEAAFGTQADGTIEDSEERDIVAAVVEWILDAPAGAPPSPEDIVRKSIETLIAEVILTEGSATIRSNGTTPEARRSAERQIRDAAEEYARQVPLTSTGATEAEMSTAIEQGIRDIGRIFGVES